MVLVSSSNILFSLGIDQKSSINHEIQYIFKLILDSWLAPVNDTVIKQQIVTTPDTSKMRFP